MTNRRTFMMQVAACGSLLGATQAMAQAKLDPKDPMAIALGYVEDTTKADQKKYPNHKPDQKCNNCALYQGKATDKMALCPAVGNKNVVAAGWCSAWAKKA